MITMKFKDMMIDYLVMNNIVSMRESNYMKVEDIIEKSRPFIFNFDYGIDPRHKDDVEIKIMSQYLMREIAHETPALFRHNLRTALTLIMPHYNQLYELSDKEIDILNNYDYQESGTRDVHGTSSGKNESSDESTNTMNSKNKGSNQSKNWEVPVDNSFTINSINPSTASVSEDSTNSDANGSNKGSSKGSTETIGDTKETYSNIKKGNMGLNPVDQMIKYRESIINIDRMIVEDPKIKNLFLGWTRTFN